MKVLHLNAQSEALQALAEMSIADLLDARTKQREQGSWVPASGGTETEFKTRGGVRLLYCYQPSTGNHAYLNCDTDIFLTNEEAQLILNM